MNKTKPEATVMNIYETRYVLAVKNLNASSEYYQEVLGFNLIDQYPGWAFLSRDSFTVMLGECRDEVPASETGDHAYFGYLEVKGATSLFDELKSNGAEFIKEIRDEPWGMREFGVITIDGHKMMFGQDLDK